MINNVYIAIMAGGGGTRLWPLSRRSHPKHTLPLFSGRSLYELTLDRLEGLVPNQRFLIITTEFQKKILKHIDKRMKPSNFLLEPEPKGTASVAAIASYAAYHKDPDAIVALLPSDHIISDTKEFRELFRSACEVAATGHLVTLGIQPSYPATGYGYIEKGKSMGAFLNHDAFMLKRFREKPTLPDAQDMLQKGGYYWNSGMFFWQVKTFLEQFERFLPRQSQIIKIIAGSWKSSKNLKLDAAQWKKLVPETVDYGVMEKSTCSAVLPAEGIGWNDLGSWESFFELEKGDSLGNIVLNGEFISKESKKVLVYSENSDKLISLIGVDDLVVIDTQNALLVCRKQDTQKIKDVVKILQDKKKTNFL